MTAIHKHSLKNVNSTAGQAPGFATTAEAACFLKLSKAMIHKLIGEGKLPACRFGRAVRIPWSWLSDQALRRCERLDNTDDDCQTRAPNGSSYTCESCGSRPTDTMDAIGMLSGSRA